MSIPLPSIMQEIVDLVGLPAALKLVALYPGIPFRVPTGGKEGGAVKLRLEEAMGSAPARLFMERFAGERLYIARCLHALLAERNRLICARFDQGEPASQIARDHQLTERQIRNILKQVPGEGIKAYGGGKEADDRQIGLF